MNIHERAARDTRRIITDKRGVGIDVTFVKPDNSLTKIVTCSPTKHMLKSDENGFKTVAKTASLAISEAAMKAVGYPVRDANSEVSLLQHKVNWTDVSGLTWTYTIRQTRPDESMGIIVCILDDYEAPITPDRIITGWHDYTIRIEVVTTPNGGTQILGNGDVIPIQYALNNDAEYDTEGNLIKAATLTIPYLASVSGISVLTPFMVDNNPEMDMPYDAVTGTFDPLPIGTFQVDVNKMVINASLPMWSI